jgi:orotidine-5'-phosphate decarboxylase
MIRRVKVPEMIEKGIPADGLPWICDCRTYDIPATIAHCIRNAAPGLVAITLSMMGGKQMIEVAEQAAAERGIRVLWWFGPSHTDLSDVGKRFLRQTVAAVRERLLGGHLSVRVEVRKDATPEQ